GAGGAVLAAGVAAGPDLAGEPGGAARGGLEAAGVRRLGLARPGPRGGEPNPRLERSQRPPVVLAQPIPGGFPGPAERHGGPGPRLGPPPLRRAAAANA